MSKMRPIIIKWRDGSEKWYPSMSDVVKETGLHHETLRQIIEYGRFGSRNRQGIEMMWWSDWDRNKLGEEKTEHLLNRYVCHGYGADAIIYTYTKLTREQIIEVGSLYKLQARACGIDLEDTIRYIDEDTVKGEELEGYALWATAEFGDPDMYDKIVIEKEKEYLVVIIDYMFNETRFKRGVIDGEN